jgi:hypothetical protein
MPVVKPNNDEEIENQRPLYYINSRQDLCLERIKMIVGRDKEEDWFNNAESKTSSNNRRLDEQQQDILEGYVLQLILSLLDYVLSDNEYTSALISGIAVLGISAESSWLSLLIYTPKQSAVVSTLRMLVLYRSTQMRQD